jgi:two-component system response regulator MprA
MIVEDDPSTRLLYEEVLRADGHQICWAATALGALDLLRTERINVIVLDLELRGLMSGVDVKRHVPDRIPVCVVTGYKETYKRDVGDNPDHPLANVAAVLFKPFPIHELVDTVNRLFRSRPRRSQ